MRKTIRFMLLISIMIIDAFSLSACGKAVADEEQIKQELESKEFWSMSPLKGIEESAIATLLSGQVVSIDGEEWSITQENLLNFEIDEQQTNLEQKTDQVTISLVLDDKLERAEGKIEVLFIFDQEWKFDSIISKDDFTVSMKAEYGLNISEDDLIAKIIEHELPVGETKQTISVEKEEISGFKIDEQKVESKGSQQVYQCNYIINKSQVVLEMETVITYTYQDGDGWNGSVNKTTSKVISADIEKKWVGTYLHAFTEEKAELHIMEVKDDGTVTAAYTFDEGSYELSGTWNQGSLELWLEAGDWIIEPEKIRISNDKDKITGELKLEKDRIEANTRQGFIYFVVAKD